MTLRGLTAYVLTGALAVALVPVLTQAASPGAYKAPRTADGRPDLEGAWTNSTLTPLERPAEYGERLVLTPQETAVAEKGRADSVARGNQATDPNATVADIAKSCDLRGFGADVGCAYNSGWTDPADRVMRVAGQPRASFITSPANGRMPAMTPAGAQRAAVRGTQPRPGMAQNDNPETRSLGERCLMSFGFSSGPVMQPQLYNSNYQFVQTKDELAIWVEMVHDVRHIRIGGQHRTDGVRNWMGDSIGRWDGDTLVVETINYHPLQNFRGASAGLKVTERFTRTAPDHIRYQFAVEDPATWQTSWGGEYEFGKTNGRVYEYACHEGNYGLEGILAGARAEEATVAARTASAAPATGSTR